MSDVGIRCLLSVLGFFFFFAVIPADFAWMSLPLGLDSQLPGFLVYFFSSSIHFTELVLFSISVLLLSFFLFTLFSS